MTPSNILTSPTTSALHAAQSVGFTDPLSAARHIEALVQEYGAKVDAMRREFEMVDLDWRGQA
jgi:hypothetical protein